MKRSLIFSGLCLALVGVALFGAPAPSGSSSASVPNFSVLAPPGAYAEAFQIHEMNEKRPWLNPARAALKA